MSTASHRRRAAALRAGRRRHNEVSSGHVAIALADAFLTVPWQRAALIVVGRTVLGRRPSWLPPIVTAVLRAYREAPVDRPRELAGFIGRGPRVQPGVVRERRVTAVRTVRMRWRVPAIDDLAALADFLDVDTDHLDWFADRKELNRRSRVEKLRHYRYTWLPHRLIEAPKPRLRALQRHLLDTVVGLLPVHDSAHGFVPGRSVHTFAAPHAGCAMVVRLDLRAFFTSISAGRVYALLRTAGYPEPVAHTLTALFTTSTPAAILKECSPLWAARLRQPHLPQGAPSSPALANLCSYRLDRRLAGLAARFEARYTRYADDLAFSGDFGRTSAQHLIDRVTAIVSAEGFAVHPAKTRVRGRADQQRLAGLVVNEAPAVSRTEYDRLRALLHNAARDGVDPSVRAHLAGRVAWVGHRHPARAAKLQQLLAAVQNA